MNAKDLRYFKNIILQKRRDLLQSKGMLESDSMHYSGKDTDTGDSKYTTHLADLGSDTMDRELKSYFNARAGKYMKHLDEALKRIEKGTYGVCLVCGKEIPKERLQEVPHTRHCVPCKSQQE
jgi:RNA polymerase-binding protein DksA